MRYNILNITQLIIYQRYYKNWITDASEKNYTFRKKNHFIFSNSLSCASISSKSLSFPSLRRC